MTEADIARQVAEDEDTASRRKKSLPPAGVWRLDDIEDVRALRTRLGLSQEAFAARYGFSVATIRQYETKCRRPSGPVRTLLRVIAREPDAVTRALSR